MTDHDIDARLRGVENKLSEVATLLATSLAEQQRLNVAHETWLREHEQVLDGTASSDGLRTKVAGLMLFRSRVWYAVTALASLVVGGLAKIVFDSFSEGK